MSRFYGINTLMKQAALHSYNKCKDLSKDTKDGKDCKDDIIPTPSPQQNDINNFGLELT
jgi:hypothetical protein